MWNKIIFLVVLCAGCVVCIEYARRVSAVALESLPTVKPGDPDPNAILLDAMKLQDRRPCVGAKLDYEILLFGTNMRARGEYLENKENPHSGGILFKMEYKTSDSAMLYTTVVDTQAQTLWKIQKEWNPQDQNIFPSQLVQRVSLDAVKRAGIGDNVPWCGLCGFSQLFRTLQRNYDFRIADHCELKGRPEKIIRLVGQWKPDVLTEIMKKRGADVSVNPLDGFLNYPEEIPARVILYLGAEDRFIRRLEYLRPSASGEWHPVSSMDVTDINFNVRFQSDLFTYKTSHSTHVDDITSTIIREMQPGKTP